MTKFSLWEKNEEINTQKSGEVRGAKRHAKEHVTGSADLSCLFLLLPLLFIAGCALTGVNNSGQLSVTGLTPSSAPAGTTSQAITVSGRNFASSSTVVVNGNPRTTTFISPLQVSVVLGSTDLAQAGSL